MTCIDNYEFYPLMDSVGYDICYYPNKTYNELKEIADNDERCAGFNTYGFLKYKIIDQPDFITLYGTQSNLDGLYVKKNMIGENNLLSVKIDKILDNKINKEKSNLTFTITTCKRLDLFKETINMFILNCQDVHLIDEWVCIDDNSSPEDRAEMIKLYPFFNFYMKNEKNKGHAKSMNILLDIVKTDYVVHFEDDWLLKDRFSIIEYLTELQKHNFDQIILRWIGGQHPLFSVDNKFNIKNYVYNPNHMWIDKLSLNKDYIEENGFSREKIYDEKDYWWWPGFSLNPSIFNITKFKKKVGYFREDIIPGLFEFDYALRANSHNMMIGFIELDIKHLGEQVSSYTLNGCPRGYE